MPSMEDDIVELRKIYEEANQGHVFNFWNELNSEEKEILKKQLKSINPKKINLIYEKALKSSLIPLKEKGELTNLPEEIYKSTYSTSKEELDEFYQLGLKAISENKIAVLLMAGGQGIKKEGRRIIKNLL